MKVLSFFALGFIAIASSALAQDTTFKQMKEFNPNVIDLSKFGGDVSANRDLLGGPQQGVDMRTIEDKLKQGGSQLYNMQNSAILMQEGKEPVLLVPGENGLVNGWYICRIIPICSEKY